MKKIAVLTLTTHGHSLPISHYLSQLSTDKYEVRVFTSHLFTQKYFAKFETSVYPSTYTTPQPFSFIRHAAEVFDSYIINRSFLENQLKSYKPDLVLYDGTLLFAPYLLSSLDLNAQTYSAVPRVRFDYLSESIELLKQPLGSIRLALRLRKQLGKYKIPPLELASPTPNKTLFFTIPELNPDPKPLDVYTGLSIRDEEITSPLQDFIDRNNENMLVYISSGTVFENDKHLLEIEIPSLLSNKYPRFAVIHSTEHPVSTLTKNSRYYHGTFLPQQKILDFADVFVTHGGFNSINEAIFHKVPMLINPHMIEQHQNAIHLTDLKVGMFAKNLANLTSQLETLLAWHDRHKLERLSHLLVKTSSQSNADQMIESFLK